MHVKSAETCSYSCQGSQFSPKLTYSGKEKTYQSKWMVSTFWNSQVFWYSPIKHAIFPSIFFTSLGEKKGRERVCLSCTKKIKSCSSKVFLFPTTVLWEVWCGQVHAGGEQRAGDGGGACDRQGLGPSGAARRPAEAVRSDLLLMQPGVGRVARRRRVAHHPLPHREDGRLQVRT